MAGSYPGTGLGILADTRGVDVVAGCRVLVGEGDLRSDLYQADEAFTARRPRLDPRDRRSFVERAFPESLQGPGVVSGRSGVFGCHRDWLEFA
jgi:hypothetical protein